MNDTNKDTPPIPSPLFQEVVNEFETMATTVYHQRTRADRATGAYQYDCVGFVSYALKHAAPQAWDTVFKFTGIAKGRIPSPLRYRRFFASLAKKPQPGWDAVTKAAELRPGDVVAWERKTGNAVGHAVVIGGAPVRLSDRLWLVKVYDSTSSPHSDDSRPKDPRAQLLVSTGQRSGLGRGAMVFIADPASGTLIGFRWSQKATAITVPIAAARPIS